MSRMIDNEEELKDYGLIEKCSNLVTDENKCLDTWDDENADYRECKRINCYKKQLKQLETENEKLKAQIDSCNDEFGCVHFAKLKSENEKLKKELEWQKVANRKFLLDKDFLTSELRDLRIEYAKLYQLNEKLKKALEEVRKLGEKTGSMKLIEMVDEVLK